MKLTQFIQQNKPSIRFSLFLSSFVAMGFVLAEGHHYTYASDSLSSSQNSYNTAADSVQPQRVYRTSYDPVPTRQYSYPPSTQKPGSNPFRNNRNRTVTHTYPEDSYQPHRPANSSLSSAGYSYPPPIQKLGSNPFFRNNKQYAGTYKTETIVEAAEPAEMKAANKMVYDQMGVIYIYPPLTKKLGSNPFNKPAQQYAADSALELEHQEITSSEQKKYRYLYHYQPQPRYIESDNSFMSYTDTHLMYP